jgi:hypothetical protein
MFDIKGERLIYLDNAEKVWDFVWFLWFLELVSYNTCTKACDELEALS